MEGLLARRPRGRVNSLYSILPILMYSPRTGYPTFRGMKVWACFSQLN